MLTVKRERTARPRSHYTPPTNGLHVITHDEEENAFFTVAKMEFESGEAARAAWGIAACRYADVEADLVVDLYIDGDLLESCEIWRQALEPMRKELGA